MNWITNFVRPKIKGMFGGKPSDTPDNLWIKCGHCGTMIFHRDFAAAQNVCHACDHHMRIGPKERFAALFDGGAWEDIATPDVPADPLKFRDEKRYTDRLKDARAKTGAADAIQIARGAIGGVTCVVAVQNFAFMGGSLGMAVGEGIITAARLALDTKCPFILFTASGGARMQEGILSLMQMPRTTVAIEEVKEAGLPYIVVLTDPTSGGVMASYAMLGDIQLAEPGALLAFSGPRVIEQTIREKLPEGFQRSEFLHDHGMVDIVVHRHRLREALTRLVGLLTMPKDKPARRPKPEVTDVTVEPAPPPALPAAGA